MRLNDREGAVLAVPPTGTRAHGDPRGAPTRRRAAPTACSREGDWTFVPSRAVPVCTASTSAAVSPWAMARARAAASAAVARGPAECSSHFSTAVLVVSYLRPTLRPGKSPRWNRA
jgi:hypothetical protein